MSNVIQIESITIKQDEEGRYCLNDLHKAAGGEAIHGPAQFFRTESTQALIEELSNCAEMHITPWLAQRGYNGGTYVVRELVYAYAMWISPAFNLKVIRAFDRLNTQGVAVAEHAAADLLKNPLKYLEALMGQAKELQEQLDVAKPKADVFDAHVADKGETLARFIRTLEGVNSMATKKDLLRLGYLYQTGGVYRVYSKHRDVLFTEKLNPHDSRGCYDIFPTAEGKQRLVKLMQEGKLTMKKAA